VATPANGAPGGSEDEQDHADDNGDDAKSPENRHVKYQCENEQNYSESNHVRAS
jgi:hypothetical protein